LARAAGALQRERDETALGVRTKTASIDLVTEVDQACEALIVGALRRERPGDAILAEEGSGEDRPGAEWRWVIDPLDGTMNYAHGYPRFCVSIRGAAPRATGARCTSPTSASSAARCSRPASPTTSTAAPRTTSITSRRS